MIKKQKLHKINNMNNKIERKNHINDSFMINYKIINF